MVEMVYRNCRNVSQKYKRKVSLKKQLTEMVEMYTRNYLKYNMNTMHMLYIMIAQIHLECARKCSAMCSINIVGSDTIITVSKRACHNYIVYTYASLCFLQV